MPAPLKGDAPLGFHDRFRVKATPFCAFEGLRHSLELDRARERVRVRSLEGTLRGSFGAGKAPTSLDFVWQVTTRAGTREVEVGRVDVTLTDRPGGGGLKAFAFTAPAARFAALDLFAVLYEHRLFDTTTGKAEGTVRLAVRNPLVQVKTADAFADALSFGYELTLTTTATGLDDARVGQAVPFEVKAGASSLPLPAGYRLRFIVWDDATDTGKFVEGEWRDRPLSSSSADLEPQAGPLRFTHRVGVGQDGRLIYPLDDRTAAKRTATLNYFSYALQVVRTDTVGTDRERPLTVFQRQDQLRVKAANRPRLERLEVIGHGYRAGGGRYPLQLAVELANFSPDLERVGCHVSVEAWDEAGHRGVYSGSDHGLPRAAGGKHAGTLTIDVDGNFQPDEVTLSFSLHPVHPATKLARTLAFEPSRFRLRSADERAEARHAYPPPGPGYVSVERVDADQGLLGTGDLAKVTVRLATPAGFVPSRSDAGEPLVLTLRLVTFRERPRAVITFEGARRTTRVVLATIQARMTPALSRLLCARREVTFLSTVAHPGAPVEDERLPAGPLERLAFRLDTRSLDARYRGGAWAPIIDAEVRLDRA